MVGGAKLPITISTVANAYLMAANGSAAAYAGLTASAARLIESFGSDALEERFMTPMYAGQWAAMWAPRACRRK